MKYCSRCKIEKTLNYFKICKSKLGKRYYHNICSECLIIFSRKGQQLHKKEYIKGYRNIIVNGKTYREHRYIIEQHIKRKLKNNEVVHHINGDKLDNRLENLKIMNRGEHISFHLKGKKKKKELENNIKVCKIKPKELSYREKQKLFWENMEKLNKTPYIL